MILQGRNHTAQRGFTLIEVMIALFVFAVGILTVAGLQIVSKKANYDAVQRTTATLLAKDIIQRMRVADDDDWDLYLVEDLGMASLAAPGVMCDAGVSCSPEQMAAYDLYEWERALDGVSEGNAGGLVDPSACVRGPAAGGEGTYFVIIAWRGTTELSDPVIDNGINGLGSCGAGGYDTNDAYRRVLMFTTYMSP